MKASILAALVLLIASFAGENTTPAANEEPRGNWSWPLSPEPAVLRAFDPPAKPWLSGHRGVDLQSGANAAQVMSPEAGTVTFVGVVVDRPVITIDHGGIKSSFEPVESTLTAGTAVSKGDVIGTVLTGHCGVTPCLHWGVRRGEEYLNPLSFVRDLRPSVLLPLTARGLRQSRA